MSREEEIRRKGFNLMDYSYNVENAPAEYKKIKVGPKMLEDAVLNLGSIKNNLSTRQYAHKSVILNALANNDIRELRNISNFYYNISGIYSRVCEYFSYLYRYDWYVVPEIYDDKVADEVTLLFKKKFQEQ